MHIMLAQAKDASVIHNVMLHAFKEYEHATLPSSALRHLWGIEEGRDSKLTIVGYHKESKTVHPILVDGWTIGLGGPVNGADAHTPSNVKIPKPGGWAILLYINESYFDTLIYDINE
ncbi:hypothetical protein [Lysinibacillus xylanilyticus]|uniref:hypothetical protein n=1 Tax=Lysinibacillus xylanilyticus TaxID=582475 RepID=UPI003D080EB5